MKAQTAELRASAMRCYAEGVAASVVQSLLDAADECDAAVAAYQKLMDEKVIRKP